MVNVQEIVAYTDKLLEVDRYSDYCPNGLQIEGAAEVRKIICGVTASQAFIDAAVAAGGDLLLVHHGYFWKGEAPVLTGMKRRRIGALLDANANLVAYHLPLDGHSEFGNNVALAKRLGFNSVGRCGPNDLVFFGELASPLQADMLAAHIEHHLGRAPLHLAAEQDEIRTIAWCSGGAQSYIDIAVELGVDAYLSGEVSEQTYHTVKECGIHFFGAGHHATERYGVQALGQHLAQRFALDYAYIELENPI